MLLTSYHLTTERFLMDEEAETHFALLDGQVLEILCQYFRSPASSLTDLRLTSLNLHICAAPV